MNKPNPFHPVLAVFLLAGSVLSSQIISEDIARDKEWEAFMASAAMTVEKQLGGVGAVTNPFKMILEKDGLKRFAVWKNPEGRMKGALEGWMWEIAAYRLDRYLGLNMIPVTIERRYEENRGSLQLWIDKTFPYLEVMEGRIPLPGGDKEMELNRRVSLQRAFDDLIYNEDRHANNMLLTEDWRMILIDHSRSFRTNKQSTNVLLYNDESKTHPGTFLQLPETFVEKLKSLTPDVIGRVTDPYLTKKEIEAVLTRRDLILKEIDRLVEKFGSGRVIY